MFRQTSLLKSHVRPYGQLDQQCTILCLLQISRAPSPDGDNSPKSVRQANYIHTFTRTHTQFSDFRLTDRLYYPLSRWVQHFWRPGRMLFCRHVTAHSCGPVWLHANYASWPNSDLSDVSLRHSKTKCRQTYATFHRTVNEKINTLDRRKFRHQRHK